MTGFYDKHHQLRTHFYKPRDNIHLSRSGTKGLLGLINQTLYAVENLDKCVYSVRSQQMKSTDNAKSADQRRNRYDHRNDRNRDTNDLVICVTIPIISMFITTVPKTWYPIYGSIWIIS